MHTCIVFPLKKSLRLCLRKQKMFCFRYHSCSSCLCTFYKLQLLPTGVGDSLVPGWAAVGGWGERDVPVQCWGAATCHQRFGVFWSVLAARSKALWKLSSAHPELGAVSRVGGSLSQEFCFCFVSAGWCSALGRFRRLPGRLYQIY